MEYSLDQIKTTDDILSTIYNDKKAKAIYITQDDYKMDAAYRLLRGKYYVFVYQNHIAFIRNN